MPEGHTIHRLARRVRDSFRGEHLDVTSPQGRFASGAALVDGRVLRRVDAHGKHLFLGFDELWVHVHLGLFGTVTLAAAPAPDPRPTVRMRMVGGSRYLDLRGPTICEVVTAADKATIHARLGSDPLRADARPDDAYGRIRRRGAPIGAVLLDQSVVAGVGNVYRSEVLHRAGVSPFLPGRLLAEPVWAGIWEDLTALLRAGVRSGRIVTTAPEHRSRRSGRVRRDDALYVYGRTGEACRRCGARVRADDLAARRVYWCPTCQPE